MDTPELVIDSGAIAANWQALDRLSFGKAAAVVKADGYGLGIVNVASVLQRAGAQSFFVATPSEARTLAATLSDVIIYDLSGLSAGQDLPHTVIPVINNAEQMARAQGAFALNFDTGMSRLGFSVGDVDALADLKPTLVMSHLASADDPDHPQNTSQLSRFRAITEKFASIPASLAATGGVLLGADYHFDMTRPGIGIYGGAPFRDARPVVNAHFPVINTRLIKRGTAVGYGASFIAREPMRLATVLGGYADGIMRAFAGGVLFSGQTACPIIGRISMDAITVDISALEDTPLSLSLFGPGQALDDLAEIGNTIGYELLTALGGRYKRRNV